METPKVVGVDSLLRLRSLNNQCSDLEDVILSGHHPLTDAEHTMRITIREQILEVIQDIYGTPD